MNTDVRKALDAMATALDNEEFDAVEKVCRAVLREAKGGLTPIGLENEARSYLLSALFGVFGTNNLSERAERMLIREIDLQCDRLFTGYLSVRDKKSASNLLLRKMNFYRDNKYGEDALETGLKLVDLFGKSPDEGVMSAVSEGYDYLIEALHQSDPRFVDVCRSYGYFLQRRGDSHDCSTTILDMVGWLHGWDNAAAISIAEEFLVARVAELSLDDETNLRSRLAGNYLFVGRFEEAINTCNWLLMNANDGSSLDYILWCGEAYMKLGRENVAAMYFREVQQALASDPEDERAREAEGFLKQLASANRLPILNNASGM